jgi:hypothetical protein
MKFITESNQFCSSTPIFFTILDYPNLKSWWEDEKQEKDIPSFTCISKLNIQYCPQLACMPLYPGLDEELVLVELNIKSMRDTICIMPTVLKVLKLPIHKHNPSPN